MVLLVLLLAAASALLFYGRGGNSGRAAELSIDGTVVQRWELDKLDKQLVIEPEGLRYPMVIRIGSDGVYVEESGCPTLDCVHTGQIRRSGESIVCLPNRLVIRIVSDSGSDIDSVIG